MHVLDDASFREVLILPQLGAYRRIGIPARVDIGRDVFRGALGIGNVEPFLDISGAAADFGVVVGVGEQRVGP